MGLRRIAKDRCYALQSLKLIESPYPDFRQGDLFSIDFKEGLMNAVRGRTEKE